MSTFRMALAGSVLWIGAAAFAFAAEGVPAASGLTVHEWGTFTSVAGPEGAPVTWTVLGGATDLPCFVKRLGPVAIKSGPTTVRMETPVLYFYAPSRMKVSAHVQFNRGMITEWYPQAAGQVMSAAQWGPFEVLPGASGGLPSSSAPSHYFAARETDAALLQVGDQREKMIFYRGAGSPDVPLRPTFLRDGRLQLRNTGAETIAFAVVFENRGGKTGYRIVRGLEKEAVVDLPAPGAPSPALHDALAAALTDAGLFPKEARAMLATWRDSWFEQGTRIFYVLPRAAVDRALALHVSPEPRETARVFVGRVEVLAPAERAEILTALAATDTHKLASYGRFLDAYIRLFNGSAFPLATQQFLDAQYARAQQEYLHPACSQ